MTSVRGRTRPRTPLIRPHVRTAGFQATQHALQQHLRALQLARTPGGVTNVYRPIAGPGGGGAGGAASFLDLTDTPASYVGSSLKVVRVNAGETALEFATAGSGSKIQDADGDTKVDTEEAADEDKVRMDVAATERFVLQGTTPHLLITGDFRASVSVQAGAGSGFDAPAGDTFRLLGSSYLEMNQRSAPAAGASTGRWWEASLASVSFPFHTDNFGRHFSMLGGYLGNIFAQGSFGAAESTDATIDRYGLWAGSVTVTGTPTYFQEDAEGFYTHLVSGAVSGNECGIQIGATGLGYHERRFDCAIRIKFRIPIVTSIRAFIGLSDASLATTIGADDPAQSMVGLQYSTARGDAQFRWYRNDGVGAGTHTSATAVPSTTQEYTVLIYSLEAAPAWVVVLYDSAFTVLSQVLVIGNSPGAGTRLSVIAAVETQTAAARELDFYYARGANLK